jgi:hypothetical protein
MGPWGCAREAGWAHAGGSHGGLRAGGRAPESKRLGRSVDRFISLDDIYIYLSMSHYQIFELGSGGM